MIILNAFSINMLEDIDGRLPRRDVEIEEIDVDRAVELLTDPDLGGVESFVGHEDTARIFTAELGIEIPFNRGSVALNPENGWAIVGQYRGPRLPEGATSLPEGAVIRWFEVEIKS